MKKALITLVLVGLVCVIAITLSAQPEPAKATKVKPTDLKRDYDPALIDQLLAMTPAERSAYIHALDREERRGLWSQVKAKQFERRGNVPLERGKLPKPHPVDVGRTFPKMPGAVGTIVYDSGFPTIGFGGDELVGNRFNTHTGIPVHASGTVSTVQGLVVPGPINTSSSAGFVLLGPQTTMGGALAIASSFNVATGVIDSLSFTGLAAAYTGSSFFVLFGDFAISYIPVFGTGTTMGQGGHGVVGFTGGAFPNIVSTFDFGGALNSYVRASGTIVPVELMSFDVN